MHRGEQHRSRAVVRISARIAASATLMAALGLGAGAASALAGTTNCSSTLTSVTLNGNVSVPAGATCTLVDSSVTGNITVNRGATLDTQGATIGGNVVATAAADVSIADDTNGQPSVVSKNVQSSGSGPVSISSSHVKGSVLITGGGPFTLISSQVGKSVQVSRQPANSSPNSICTSTITGGVQITFDLTETFIGDQGGGCGPGFSDGNQISGNVQVQSNDAGRYPAALVTDNTIHGNLQCSANEQPAQASGNSVFGKAQGECAAGGKSVCAATSVCFGASTDGSTDSTITTGGSNATITITFGGPPLPCTTPGTGPVTMFTVTNPGPGNKTITANYYGAAAVAANMNPGHVCYESPNQFTTASGQPATPTAGGYYGVLPSCDITEGTPPCVEFYNFFSGEGPDTYVVQFIVPQSDPFYSN